MAAKHLEAVTGDHDNLVALEELPYEKRNHKKFLLAALSGDWNAAEDILRKDNNIVRDHITTNGETILQIVSLAAEQKHVHFGAKLVEKMNPKDLAIANNYGSTALHFAALAGNQEIASLMVEKNQRLPSIKNNANVTALYMAVLSGHGCMVKYLLQFADFGSQDALYGCTILNMCIDTGLYGIALEMVDKYKFLAVAKDDENEGPLDVLARQPSAFVGEGGGQLRLWRGINYTSFWKKVQTNKKSPPSEVSKLLYQIWETVECRQGDVENPTKRDNRRLLFVAAETGNYGFLIDLLRRHPDLLYVVNGSNHSIFHIAVLNRYESIFSLIYEIGKLKDFLATYVQNDNTNMLHLAGRLAPSCQLNVLPGAALQMQRELLWYKEVEKIVPSSYKKMKNANGKTPHDVFMEEHKDLMEKGEKWMKKTAQSCMVVATLIATVVFTTAFTIPGGNNDRNGMPILLRDKFFVVFMISEIIAMLSASTSIIMFLCILTSPYAEEDFLESLPFWLLSGTTTLFVSLAAMMIAFCTTFLLFNQHGLANVPNLLGLFAFMPLMFFWFKYPLLVEILCSTYASRSLFRPPGRLFHT